jgi:hypothetical protein
MSTSQDTNTVGEVAGSTSSSKGFGTKVKRFLIALVSVVFIAALVGYFQSKQESTSQSPATTPETTVAVSDGCPHVDLPQATDVGPQHGGIYTAEYQDLAIPVVDGKPNLDANKYPVSSQEAKERYFHPYCSSAMMLYTFTENNANMLGFDSGVQNVSQLVEQRSDGKWYYNTSGKELLLKLHQFIFRDDVTARIIWIEQALAATLNNANNNGSWTSFSPLAYDPDKGMTAWEIALNGTDEAGNPVVIEVARQLTRCGNLTPPKNPDEPKIPQKEPMKIGNDGSGWQGNPNQPVRPPVDGGSNGGGSGSNTIHSDDTPGSEYDPGRDGGTYTPPNPKIDPTPVPPIAPPVVIVPPEEPAVVGDDGGF